MTKFPLILTILLLTFSCADQPPKKKLSTEPHSERSKKSSTEIQDKIKSVSVPTNLKSIGEKTSITYSLGDFKIQLNQHKSDGTQFYCKAEIIISKNSEQINYIDFLAEPVGGNYGISNATRCNNHLIFTKHGDYDGRTLIINDKGQVFDIIGGQVFLDEAAEILFSIYESDMNGVAIFDLQKDSILLEMEEMEESPQSFHKAFENRYFMTCINEESEEQTIWEFEFELERIIQVELDQTDINSQNELKKVSRKDVDCICEK